MGVPIFFIMCSPGPSSLIGFKIFRAENNLINGPDLPKNYITLKSKLNEWIESTGDDIPDSLTKDWYLIEQEPYNETSLLKTKHHGIRGTMPGHLSNAINNNNKGPF